MSLMCLGSGGAVCMHGCRHLHCARKLQRPHSGCVRACISAGISNVCVGLIGAGYTGSYIFSQTVFTMRAGVFNRLCGLVVALMEVAVFALPFSVVEVRQCLQEQAPKGRHWVLVNTVIGAYKGVRQWNTALLHCFGMQHNAPRFWRKPIYNTAHGAEGATTGSTRPCIISNRPWICGERPSVVEVAASLNQCFTPWAQGTAAHNLQKNMFLARSTVHLNLMPDIPQPFFARASHIGTTTQALITLQSSSPAPQYCPSFFFGALLLWFGSEICRDWLVLSHRKLSMPEYALLW